jgi:uncharacterized protein YjiS (DUF1127 family)
MKGQKGYAVAGAGFRGQLQLPTLAAVWRRLRRWQQLARERRQLATLDEQALKDLGVSRASALQEAQRPFWDDPLQ